MALKSEPSDALCQLCLLQAKRGVLLFVVPAGRVVKQSASSRVVPAYISLLVRKTKDV